MSILLNSRVNTSTTEFNRFNFDFDASTLVFNDVDAYEDEWAELRALKAESKQLRLEHAENRRLKMMDAF